MNVAPMADGAEYVFHVKEFFSTGLQVAKDPGVWLVYLGCALMLIGLGVAFFMSHKRVWIYINEKDGITTILLAGTANKDKPGFEREFAKMSSTLTNSQSIEVQK